MKVLKQIPNNRRAFTLLELMIVVAIIGLLMSMSVVVMNGFVGQAEEEATSATIQKINRMLEERIEAFDRAFNGARRDTALNGMRALLADPNQDLDQADGIFGVKDAVVEILAKKALFRFEFPQRFVERLSFEPGPVLVPGLPNSVYYAISAPAARVKLGLPVTTPLDDPSIIADVATTFALGASSPATESSELLYFALVKSASYGAASVDSDRFTENEIRDTDGDGLPEFVDAWGQPLRYYRWPTRLIDTNPMVPLFQPDFADVADATDLDMTPDDIDSDGLREVVSLERDVANMLLKGLPPSPSVLPNGAVPRDLLLIDPDDPVGRLYAELERLPTIDLNADLDGADGGGEVQGLAAEFNEARYHTPDTFHAPLVVSAGLDGKLGLYEPNDTANVGNLAAYDSTLTLAQVIDVISDNITSRNKMSGGRQ